VDLPVLPDPSATKLASPFRSIGRDYQPVEKSKAAAFVDFSRHNQVSRKTISARRLRLHFFRKIFIGDSKG
jgi:hypothetical protein